MLESLEARRFLSVTLEDGVLTVTGTELADQLFIARNQTTGQFVVNDNGTATSFAPDDVTSVVMNGLAENDRIGVGPGVNRPIRISGAEGNDFLTGGHGRELIFGDAGNDRINGGGGGDALNGGADDDFITGGPGQDHMFGGPGSDHFDSVDAFMDALDGGEGEDFARIGRGDRALNIEHVFAPRPQPTNDLGFAPDELVEGALDPAAQMVVDAS